MTIEALILRALRGVRRGLTAAEVRVAVQQNPATVDAELVRLRLAGAVILIWPAPGRFVLPTRRSPRIMVEHVDIGQEIVRAEGALVVAHDAADLARWALQALQSGGLN